LTQSLWDANQAMLHDISVPTPTDIPVWRQGEIEAEKAVVGLLNLPTELLIGVPLIGNGADGTPTHPGGFDGGLLDGNGGNGIDGGNGGNSGFIGGQGGDGADGTWAHPNGGNGGDGWEGGGRGGQGYSAPFSDPGGNGGNGGNGH
jgi:hypothetical protein